MKATTTNDEFMAFKLEDCIDVMNFDGNIVVKVCSSNIFEILYMWTNLMKKKSWEIMKMHHYLWDDFKMKIK